MSDFEPDDWVLPVEIFAGKDANGLLTGAVMMTVPRRCGLRQADTLRIDGDTVVAMQARSILPVDFPALTQESREWLAGLAESGRKLAVGEFSALGLFDSYFLDVVVVS